MPRLANTITNSSFIDHFVKKSRPMVALSIDYADRERVPPHHHKQGQLIYAASGVVIASTVSGNWVLPSLRALWMPAGMSHWLRMHGACAMRTVYIDPKAAPHLPAECGVVEVSSLLRELVVAAMHVPKRYALNGRDGLLMQLLLSEIKITPVPALHLPMPKDSRLLAVCQALVDRPELDTSLEEWATSLAVSSKTLARRFVAEAGITFGRWRQQARLLASLPRLASGTPVLNVALDLGYAGPSAFTAMFHKALGVTPSRYFERRN